MPNHPHVEPARKAEQPSALRIVFQHLPEEDQESRVRRAMRLIRQGELDPAGVLVARQGGKLAGAMVCLSVPGASALIWPPQSALPADAGRIEDQLLDFGIQWLKQRGVKLMQSLLLPQENYLAAPLLRNGFQRTTNLQYLRHELQGIDDQDDGQSAYQTYAECDQELFHRTLLATYRDTLDCPEITGVRQIDEIIEGHRSQGVHDPEHWWLVFDEGRPAGVLLLAEVPEWNSWDLSYLGIVPASRRRGIGRELTGRALRQAHRARAGQMTLALDLRNRPASQLYRSLGFTPFEEREVYLALWKNVEPAVPSTNDTISTTRKMEI